MYCKICGSGLPVPTRQNPLYSKLTQDRPKAVVFDLDMTLFNNSQRFTDARRAGLVDKEGKAVVKRLSSKEKARNKRNKFLYSQKELAKDVVIPGATQLVSDLKNDDYTIIYLTARPAKYQEQTIKQLESKGFPLFRDMNGKPLVFSKPASRTQVPAFKGNKVRELLGNYKIEMVFDDDKRNLTEISKLSIPGLYASISDHVKHNPSHGEFDYVAKKGPKGPYVTSDLAKPDIDKAYGAMLERDGDPDNRPSTVGDTAYLEEERMKQMSIEDFLPDDFPIGPKALPNPLPKPKRKKLSNGKYRKEPKKTYADRMMNKNKKMKTDFPDRKQRYAVTMTLVEKFYGKPVKKNPSHNSCPAVTQNLEMNTRNRNSAIKADYIQYGPLNLADEDYWVKAAEHWNTTPEVAKESNCSNCVAFDISPRMLECMPGSVQDDGQLGMCWMHNFKCHSARTCYTWAAGGPITEDSVSYDWQERSGAVKSNPANNLANTFGALLDTGSINDTKFAKLMDAKTPVKISSDKISFKGVGTKNVKVTFKQVKDPSKVITYYDTMSEGDNPLFIHAMSEPSMEMKASGKSLVVDGYLMNGWRTFHKYDTHLKSKMYEADGDQGHYGFESFESAGYTVSQICQDKDGFYLWDGKEKLRFDKKELPATIQYSTIALVRETPKSSIKLMLIHYTGAVKTNPAHPSKVEKAKKLYKHMNGKAPAKIEKKKLDLGDVWYQVGEGGCWQIGYISGKDNGRDDQKYTHVFNEETKDGNFPKLYATMPEKGKPMLIITGGTWKIKTDSEGVAWIYD